MRSLVFISATALAIAGCARPAGPNDNTAFSREIAGHVAGASQSCVSTFANQNLRVIDPSTLAYGYGRTIYVNRLAGPCPGLDQLNTVIIRSYGSQYCRGDRVQGLEPGSIIPGPQCILGNWTPYRMR
jgi:hypothetical protein